jgi:general stress protein 26
MAQSPVEDALQFLREQNFVIVSTVDENGAVHNSCKDIVHVSPAGRVYLFDLYHGKTLANLKRTPNISLTAVDEHHFKGYCLKGKAVSITQEDIGTELVKAWEARITSRITSRLLKNIGGEKGHPRHPELLLPTPKFLIGVAIDEVVDLAHYQNRAAE